MAVFEAMVDVTVEAPLVRLVRFERAGVVDEAGSFRQKNQQEYC